MLTLFGGEPLLNLPVAYYLAERLWHASQARGVRMLINVITNGLLLTPEVVDRLAPYGLNAVKVTLDGDRDTHNRMRPLRGGQGTFDKIIHNVRQVAGKCRISIGGNFDESSVDSYPALLDFLREQEFADKLARVAFKPIIRAPKPEQPKGLIPLTVVGADGEAAERHVHDLGGERHERLRHLQLPRREDVLPARGDEEARILDGRRRAHGPVRNPPAARPHDRPRRRALRVPGLHRRHQAVHGTHRRPARRVPGAAPRRGSTRSRRGEECDDCAFIPVCAGGCSVAAHTELGDMDRPNCHKTSFEAGVVSLARDAAVERNGLNQLAAFQATTEERAMKNDRKEADKKKGTLRPWLVDVAVEHLRVATSSTDAR